MDRNSIIGILLIFLILVGYSLWMKPSAEEVARQEQALDSLRQDQRIKDSLALLDQIRQETIAETPDVSDSDTIAFTTEVRKDYSDAFGLFSPAAIGQQDFIEIETEDLHLTFSTKGAYIARAELTDFRSYDSLPLVLFGGDSSFFNYAFFSGNRLINTQDLFFQPYINNIPYEGEGSLRLAEGDSLILSMRAYPDAGTDSLDAPYIEFAYSLRGSGHMLGYDIRLYRLGQALDSRVKYLTLDWGAHLRQHEKSLQNERATTTIYYKFSNESVDRLTERKDAQTALRNRIKWVAFKQQFFSTVLIAEDAFQGANVSVQTLEGEDPRYLKTLNASIDIPFQDVNDHTIAMSMYIGPNKFTTLKKYGMELEAMIPLGWAILGWINRYAVIPVFNLLAGFNMNYGIIILILTILLKIILFPIAYKTYVSSAKMRILRPEVEEINQKFPKKEDAMKKQQATMELYRKAGVNPMAGCIPMLLQLPILIALFRFFPASIELRQQSFLWADDLSTYDNVLDLPFTIPFYGDHVSLFTLLMTISTIIYTRINSQMMSTGTQMPGMKTMLYLMPIMFLGFFNSYASGLSYYYLLANLITFAQMYIFRLVLDEDKLHRRIQANKKKPVKKSGFQKRLEEMAKQKGHKPKK